MLHFHLPKGGGKQIEGEMETARGEETIKQTQKTEKGKSARINRRKGKRQKKGGRTERSKGETEKTKTKTEETKEVQKRIRIKTKKHTHIVSDIDIIVAVGLKWRTCRHAAGLDHECAGRTPTESMAAAI